MAKTAALEYIESKTSAKGATGGFSWNAVNSYLGYVGILEGYDLSAGITTYTQYTSCIHFKTPAFDGKSHRVSIVLPFKGITMDGITPDAVKAYVSLSTSYFNDSYTSLTNAGVPAYATLDTTLFCKLYNISGLSSAVSFKTLTIECDSIESNTDYYIYLSPHGTLSREYSVAFVLADVNSQATGTITYAPPFGAIQLFENGITALPYLPHIYVDGKWLQCSPCVYSNGAWHECER